MLSLIHISEPTRLGMISYAVFCLKKKKNLVELGARHITFGDPDFLNDRRFSLRVVQAMLDRFFDFSLDCTTKVEHILRDAELWPALAGEGCLFVVSAFE